MTNTQKTLLASKPARLFPGRSFSKRLFSNCLFSNCLFPDRLHTLRQTVLKATVVIAISIGVSGIGLCQEAPIAEKGSATKNSPESPAADTPTTMGSATKDGSGTKGAVVPATAGDLSGIEKVTRTKKEWRAMLTPMQYKVTRRKGTEPAFSGEYWNSKADGTYICRCCDQPLFDSSTKFRSGTGWPSFYKTIDEKVVLNVPDNKWGMRRTENICSRCDAHLGHVFNDGPAPTGLRYCMNSASLKFVPREEELPPLGTAGSSEETASPFGSDAPAKTK